MALVGLRRRVLTWGSARAVEVGGRHAICTRDLKTGTLHCTAKARPLAVIASLCWASHLDGEAAFWPSGAAVTAMAAARAGSGANGTATTRGGLLEESLVTLFHEGFPVALVRTNSARAVADATRSRALADTARVAEGGLTLEFTEDRVLVGE